ncbi:unnamed protein product [Knipowitschia caucasica]
MNRGQTWSKEEVQCLIEIWSDEHIISQLSSTHKNADIFAIFSKQMRERGFQRSVEQCRIKTKKLRQQYIKIRDALKQTGGTSKIKDKFEWYEALDKILGTKPDVEPIDIVESNEETMEPPTDDTETEADVPGLSASLHDEEADTSLDSDVSCAQESEPTRASGRLEIPGAKSRKRKAKARGRDDDFAKYMAESHKVLEEMREADTRQLEQDQALQKMLKAQQEADERRFSALMTQMQASNQLMANCFSQLINMVNTQVPPSLSWSGGPSHQSPPYHVPHSSHQLPPSGAPPHHTSPDYYNL